MPVTEELARLRWACRRGMLELDLILSPFLEQVYPQLAEAEQRVFKEILGSPDPELLSWFMGYSQPEDAAAVHLVKKIRAHSRHSL